MDKKFWQSKKFIAFVISLLVISGMLITALVTQTIAWPLALFMAIGMLGITVITIAYTNGQATLDKFIEGVKSFNIKKDDE